MCQRKRFTLFPCDLFKMFKCLNLLDEVQVDWIKVHVYMIHSNYWDTINGFTRNER